MQADKISLIIFLITTVAAILLLAGLIITLLLLYKRNQALFQQKIDALKFEQEKVILGVQLEVQESTLQHVSREIHDNINLSLTLAKLHLNTLDINDHSRFNYQLNSSITLLSQSICDLNSLSKSLDSDAIIGFGLIRAIENEIDRIQQTGLFKINFMIEGSPIYMESRNELILYRIIQEAFNNIIKHSKANSTALKLNYKNTSLEVTIKDDGLGFEFDANDVEKSVGKSGLKNMSSRTKMINGAMSILTNPGDGCMLTFNFPLDYGTK